MKKLVKYILLFVLFAIPNIVKAECSVSELARLKKIASNITYKYNYIENFKSDSYGEVSFTITISNLTDEMSLKYSPTKNLDFKDKVTIEIKDGTAIFQNAKPGMSHRFEVYANGKTNCNEERLFTFYIAVPSYNKFYIDELCKTVPNYKYCIKWSNVKLSEEEFKKNINEYIKSLDVKEEEKIEKEEDYERYYKIISFLAKYIYYVDIPLIIICIVAIVYLKNKDNYDLKVK